MGRVHAYNFIMVISVARTRKDLEYSDTNEIIKSGKITR